VGAKCKGFILLDLCTALIHLDCLGSYKVVPKAKVAQELARFILMGDMPIKIAVKSSQAQSSSVQYQT
jgi:hypothetical protein